MVTPYFWRHAEVVSSFRQFEGETLKEANIRMKDTLVDYYGHGFHDSQILEIFYYGLDFNSQNDLNSFCQNHFLNLDADQAFQILNNLLNWNEHTNDNSPSNFEETGNKSWDIRYFTQLEGEDLEKAWSIMENLLLNYNQNAPSYQEVFEYFYFELDYDWRGILNDVSGGDFLENTFQKSLQIMEEKLYFQGNYATGDPDTWYENRNRPISNSEQRNPSFENDQSSNFCQNDFGNTNCSQGNLRQDYFENSSSFYQNESYCENPDQYQNDLNQENQDFSPVSKPYNESFKSKIEYYDTDSDEELTVEDVQRIIRTLLGKESILVPEPVEDDFTDDEIEDEDYQISLESVDDDPTNDQSIDEEIVLKSVKDLFTEEEFEIEPEPVKDNVANEEEDVLVQVIEKLEDDDDENEQMQEFPKLIVGSWGDCEDDFTDDETAEEKVMFEQELVEDYEDSNLLQPVDESADDESELSPKPEECNSEIEDDTLDEQLQELLSCDSGKTEDNKNGDITTKEFDEIMEMSIDEFEQRLEEPSTEVESELTVTIPIKSTGTIFPLTVFTGAEVINKKRKLEEEFATFLNKKCHTPKHWRNIWGYDHIGTTITHYNERPNDRFESTI